MDTEVVKTVDYPFKRAQIIAIRSAIGNRCGHIQIGRRNRIGKLVCRCDCGETIALKAKRFAEGKVFECKSCQKWRRKTPAHKMLGTKIYKNLYARGKSAMQRCCNPNDKDYKSYGADGKEFRFDKIDTYVMYCGYMALIHGLNKQIDRVDNDGHYEAGNLRMVSATENIRNRSNTIIICGRPLAEIVEEIGYAYDNLTCANLRYFIRRHGYRDSKNPQAIEHIKTYLNELRSARRLDETHETVH